MYRLFGHDPYHEYRSKDFKLANTDPSNYGIFEYNSKPFDL